MRETAVWAFLLITQQNTAGLAKKSRLIIISLALNQNFAKTERIQILH